MDENTAIQKLAELIESLDEAGKDTSSIRQFFDVGEWLIAFEGVEVACADVPVGSDMKEKVAWLRRYFAD